jgi:hypothetical protein
MIDKTLNERLFLGKMLSVSMRELKFSSIPLSVRCFPLCPTSPYGHLIYLCTVSQYQHLISLCTIFQYQHLISLCTIFQYQHLISLCTILPYNYLISLCITYFPIRLSNFPRLD